MIIIIIIVVVNGEHNHIKRIKHNVKSKTSHAEGMHISAIPSYKRHTKLVGEYVG